ncbi:MAG: NAD-dependent epimerase/dehydratase family protein [Candidatus Taylorbacteria bacterium]|nr:NAD-dependent epimerase/dehydratase family protein [Candidatus Taylorbacteria bacterium]
MNHFSLYSFIAFIISSFSFKILSLHLCLYPDNKTDFISVMPTNLYGPNDNFDLESSHVLPALLRKFHEATVSKKESVTMWGSGKPKREFMHVDDMADACVFLMNTYSGSDIVNIGTGKDVSIKQLGLLMKKITGFKGKIVWDTSKPDGMLRKRLNVSRLHKLGWKHKYDLESGVKHAYTWFKKEYK